MGVRISEKERLEFNFVLIGLDAVKEYLTLPPSDDSLLIQVDEYYSTLAQMLKEFKVRSISFVGIFLRNIIYLTTLIMIMRF